MFGKLLSPGGMLLLVGAVGCSTAGPAPAAPPGGAASGGFHGSAHFGLPNASGIANGGFHGFSFHHTPANGFRSHPFGYPEPRFYRGFRNYSYIPPLYYTPPYVNFFSNPYLMYGAGGYEEPPFEPDSKPPPAPPPPPETNPTALITVKLPADAELWFEGTRTAAKGPVRDFESPPLAPGRRYAYEIRARWMEDGQPVNQTQEVTISPGDRVTVKFPVPPPPHPTLSPPGGEGRVRGADGQKAK